MHGDDSPRRASENPAEITTVKPKGMKEYQLSHLKTLEAEAIHIIREVAAEFRNPVMLYSIGKDSSVMVRLAERPSTPARSPSR